MSTIKIDKRLQADTIQLGFINGQTLLLMNNALVPWFIILPNTRETEVYKLNQSERETLEKNIDVLSEFVLQNFDVEKLNVAAIGNIVSQMHIHIVGRHKNDFCWPGVVWGRKEREAYEESQLSKIVDLVRQELGNTLIKQHDSSPLL